MFLIIWAVNHMLHSNTMFYFSGHFDSSNSNLQGSRSRNGQLSLSHGRMDYMWTREVWHGEVAADDDYYDTVCDKDVPSWCEDFTVMTLRCNLVFQWNLHLPQDWEVLWKLLRVKVMVRVSALLWFISWSGYKMTEELDCIYSPPLDLVIFFSASLS